MDIIVMHLIPSMTWPASQSQLHYHDPPIRLVGSHRPTGLARLLVWETWPISGSHLSLCSKAGSMSHLCTKKRPIMSFSHTDSKIYKAHLKLTAQAHLAVFQEVMEQGDSSPMIYSYYQISSCYFYCRSAYCQIYHY